LAHFAVDDTLGTAAKSFRNSKRNPAKIQAGSWEVLEAAMNHQTRHFYDFGPYRLDAGERRLLRDGETVSVTPKAFDLLLVLVENRGHLLEKEELLKAVWPDTFVEEANLSVIVSHLRKALSNGGDEQRYIETVPKRGYRFVASVGEVEDEQAGLGLGGTSSGRVSEQAEAVHRDRKEAVQEAGDETLTPNRTEPAGTGRKWSLILAIACLGLVGFGLLLQFYRSKPGGVAPAVKSMAVLPFRLLSADDGDPYLGVGMADALITKLSNLKAVVVRPTSAVFKYTDHGKDSIAAGQELRVDALLDGTIQKHDGRIRVTVQLINVRNGAPFWADSFIEQATDLFAIEDLISERVARALALKLSGEEHDLLTKRYTRSSEASQRYVRGQYFASKRTPEDLKKAIQFYEEAIEIDPNYALAHAALGHCYIMLKTYYEIPTIEGVSKAKAAADAALKIDGTLAEAHLLLASVRMNRDWDWVAGEREYRRAIELKPNYAIAHQWLGISLQVFGRYEEALTEIRRAQECDPLLLILSLNEGGILQSMRKYDTAMELYRRVLEMNPHFGMAHLYLGSALIEQGRVDEGIAEIQTAISLGSGQRGLVNLGYAYAVAGRRDEAERVISELTGLAKQRYVSPFGVACIYAGLGKKDEAFEWLEKSYQEHIWDMLGLKIQPMLDGLRSDPRFSDLVRRVRVP
jgi:DNA-binding winged helix-turn-helix (wHTH) protein/TolB-like protein/Flp pilus assembly protein TadD